MKELTVIQQSVLAAIKEHLQNFHNMPTHKEIAANLGWRSANTAHGHVTALIKKGYLVKYEDGSGKYWLAGIDIKLEEAS